jgi:putative addiction module component (TIGR02574 family)
VCCGGKLIPNELSEYAVLQLGLKRTLIMTDFATVLTAAQQLPEDDRLRLIDALWQSLPAESAAAIPDEWAREIECRVAELDAGTAETTPWPQIRDEALARIGHGKSS